MSTIDPSGDPAAPSEPQSFLDRLRALLGTLRPHGSLRTDLEEVLDAGAATGEESEFTPAERKMLRNILHLKEVGIGDIMVPRAEIVAVHKDTTLAELLKVFASAAHSRLVVYDDTLDDPVGMVHIRDLIAFITGHGQSESENGAHLDLARVDLSISLEAAGLVRRLLYVPPSMPAVDLLVSMQANRTHLALVIDEYGGTDGLVSIEDVVEEIVGEIEDEHDDQEPDQFQHLEDGSLISDARVALEDAIDTLGEGFAPPEVLEEVDTIGGYVVMVAARVPDIGEIVPLPNGYAVEVLDADPRRVKRLRIIPPHLAAAAQLNADTQADDDEAGPSAARA